jgi:hypothetical protein
VTESAGQRSVHGRPSNQRLCAFTRTAEAGVGLDDERAVPRVPPQRARQTPKLTVRGTTVLTGPEGVIAPWHEMHGSSPRSVIASNEMNTDWFTSKLTPLITDPHDPHDTAPGRPPPGTHLRLHQRDELVDWAYGGEPYRFVVLDGPEQSQCVTAWGSNVGGASHPFP